MIHGENILCFAPDPWSDIWRNRHHLLTIFAQHNRVLYVEPRPYLRETVAALRAGRFPWSDIFASPIRHVMPNLFVYRTPPYAPISGRQPLRGMTAWMRRRALARQMRRLGMTHPILWICRPEMGDVIGQFGEKLVLYHVVDEYSAYAGVADAAAARRREEEVLRRADVVITTSPALYEGKRAFNRHTYLVPNAVNFAAFEAAMRDPALPADIAPLSRPWVGYVGAINTKVDLEFIGALAGAHPEWSVILVGPVSIPPEDTSFHALRSRPNVFFLGKKGVEEVPYYIKALDICLLPYRRNEWTRHISSLKLYEYMACGKPIIATDVPAAREFEELVFIVEGPAQGVAQAEQILAAGFPADKSQAEREIARRNTWQARAERISDIFTSLMHEKGLV